MSNVEFREKQSFTSFRKIAMGTWKTVKDPSVYAVVEIDMQKTLELLPEYSKKYNIKITPSHLVGKAIAFCLKRRPEVNGMIRFSKIYLRKTVSLFYQVNIPGEGPDEIKKANLAGAVIHEACKLKLHEIAKSLSTESVSIKKGKNKAIAKNLNFFKYIPWCLSGIYLNFASFLMYGLNLNLSFLGIPKDPFGSVMITNVGGLGIDLAFAPLCPYTRVPLLLTVGAIQKRPWVIGDQIQIRQILPIGVTFDHRFIDGIHASQMAYDFKECFSNPEKYLFED